MEFGLCLRDEVLANFFPFAGAKIRGRSDGRRLANRWGIGAKGGNAGKYFGAGGLFIGLETHPHHPQKWEEEDANEGDKHHVRPTFFGKIFAETIERAGSRGLSGSAVSGLVIVNPLLAHPQLKQREEKYDDEQHPRERTGVAHVKILERGFE